MFERYDEKARRVIFFARYEASEFGASEIETEHLLLGLLRENRGALTLILDLSLDEDEIRAAVADVTTKRQRTSTSIDMPLSSECKRILAFSAEEAERLQNKHITPEHLLLGMLREEKCLAAHILRDRGVKLQKARKLIAASAQDLAASSRAGTSELPPELFASLTSVAQASAGQVSASQVSANQASANQASANQASANRVVVATDSEILFSYRELSRVPRIGESICIRDGENAVHTYRIQDVIWELEPDPEEPGISFLKEVKLRVAKESAD
jgi:ATP-dependent Clp protease ATP-binding subunit ClpA